MARRKRRQLKSGQHDMMTNTMKRTWVESPGMEGKMTVEMRK